jgi:hypothetical protein
MSVPANKVEKGDHVWYPADAGSPRRVLLNFGRLLEVIVDRSAQESEVVDRLITSPHRVRVFVSALSTTSKPLLYNKAVLYVESALGDGVSASGDGVSASGGGVLFDGCQHTVYDESRKQELDTLTTDLKQITSKQLAENWTTYKNILDNEPSRKLQLQWITAYFTTK